MSLDELSKLVEDGESGDARDLARDLLAGGQDPLAMIERMTQTIVDQGGEMQVTELWGKRALAYPIKKAFHGHYVLHRFQTTNSNNDEIERLLRYSENILRYMTLRTDA